MIPHQKRCLFLEKAVDIRLGIKKTSKKFLVSEIFPIFAHKSKCAKMLMLGRTNKFSLLSLNRIIAQKVEEI